MLFGKRKNTKKLEEKVEERTKQLRETNNEIKRKDGLMREIEKNFNQELEEANAQINKLKLENAGKDKDIQVKDAQLFKALEELEEFSKKYTKLSAKAGGLTASNNRLNKKVLSLEDELKKYKPKIRKLPSTMPKKPTQKMNSKKTRAGKAAQHELKNINQLKEKSKNSAR